MNMMEAMRKENRICMAYWRNAIMLPTLEVPWSTRLLPNQMMVTVVKFITSIMTGIRHGHHPVHLDGGLHEVQVRLAEAPLLIVDPG